MKFRLVRNMGLFFMLILVAWGQLKVPFWKQTPPGTLWEKFSKPIPGNLKRNDGVCLFLSTELITKDWTYEYTRKYILWMRKVFLVSIERQFKSPCPAVQIFKLLIAGNPNEPKLADLHQYGKKRGEIPIVWHLQKDFSAIVKKTVLKHSCNWISYIWLDSDDALLDGYFKSVTEEIPKLLTETTTSEGRPWLGGVFALRSIVGLDIGLNRCRRFSWWTIFGGYSQGQGVILKRSVWDALGQKMLYHATHAIFLGRIREWVKRGLGQTEYVSMVGKHPFIHWFDTEEINAYDKKDAAESQIQMIDLSKNWTTFGLWIRTPFSSSFDWRRMYRVPFCTKEHIIEINRGFSQDIGYIIETWMEHPEIHVTMLEVCKTNSYKWRDVRKRNSTCEEEAAKFAKIP